MPHADVRYFERDILSCSQHPLDEGIIVSILQNETRRLVSLSHTASKWQGWILSPGASDGQLVPPS